MPRIPLLGGAYMAPDLIANAQRCVNLYPEKNPESSQAPVNVTHYPRPGLTPLGAPAAAGRGRMLVTATNGQLFGVIDQTIYYINPDWVFTQIGSLVNAGNTPVYMADNGTNAVIVDGTPNGYNVELSTRILTQIGDPNFMGADRVDFLDYFLLLNQINSPNFYSTEANQILFNALFFGTKTAWPDNIIAVVCVEREAWVLGPQKGEIWYNAGTVPFAFQPQPGLIIEHGCCAKYSVQKQDVNLYWLSQSPEGARMVMKGTQRSAVRISTHAIEAEFLKYPRVDDAIGCCYQLRGHAFYKLHFPTADKTWGYDEATGQWHEDLWTDKNGVLHRARNTFCAYAYGKNVGLDWATGSLYQVDESNFTDNEQPIAFIRSTPHLIDAEFDRVTFWRAIADVDVGNGPGLSQLPTEGNPWSLGFSSGFGPRTLTEPPLITLRVSLTRGHSWGNGVMQPMGAGGLYKTKPTWNRLGYGADVVLELSWSTPMKTALDGLFLITEVHEGDHE